MRDEDCLLSPRARVYYNKVYAARVQIPSYNELKTAHNPLF